MSSDPFDLLGLDRNTATDADVRRAYAAKLKVTRPEDDRAGFMALRTAFERARDEVRWREEYGDDASTDGDENDGAASEVAAFPVGAVAIGDVPLAEIAERTLDALPEAERELGNDAPDEDVDEYGLPPATEAEAAFEQRISRAMDRLVDALTATGSPPSVRQVLDAIDDDEVSGIEEYQSMQWQVRQLLCNRTGYFATPQEMRLPGWLSLGVLNTLDEYYGWTRQPVTNNYVRGMNDWLVRVRRTLALDGMPAAERQQAALEDVTTELFGERASPADKPRGGSIWLLIGAGILLSQIVRFVSGLNGGG